MVTRMEKGGRGSPGFPKPGKGLGEWSLSLGQIAAEITGLRGLSGRGSGCLPLTAGMLAMPSGPVQHRGPILLLEVLKNVFTLVSSFKIRKKSSYNRND